MCARQIKMKIFVMAHKDNIAYHNPCRTDLTTRLVIFLRETWTYNEKETVEIYRIHKSALRILHAQNMVKSREAGENIRTFI